MTDDLHLYGLEALVYPGDGFSHFLYPVGKLCVKLLARILINFNILLLCILESFLLILKYLKLNTTGMQNFLCLLDS